jgi:hypothetical protein
LVEEAIEHERTELLVSDAGLPENDAADKGPKLKFLRFGAAEFGGDFGC